MRFKSNNDILDCKLFIDEEIVNDFIIIEIKLENPEVLLHFLSNSKFFNELKYEKLIELNKDSIIIRLKDLLELDFNLKVLIELNYNTINLNLINYSLISIFLSNLSQLYPNLFDPIKRLVLSVNLSISNDLQKNSILNNYSINFWKSYKSDKNKLNLNFLNYHNQQQSNASNS